MKRLIINILLFFSFHFGVFATIQAPDILKIGCDTLYIYNPSQLAKYLKKIKIQNYLPKQNGKIGTNCWRGYVAVWSIQNDSLFLISIRSCQDQSNVDLNKVFKNSYFNNKVFVDFISCDITASKYNILKNKNVNFHILYDTEKLFIVKKGHIVFTKVNYETKPHISIYSQSDSLRTNTIYRNINWSKVPFLDFIQYISVIEFSSNENGKVDSAKVVNGNTEFDEILINAIKSIPDWDIYYNFGKHERITFKQEITINEENRKKYAR